MVGDEVLDVAFVVEQALAMEGLNQFLN